jgi:hypothetical protein
MEKINLLGLPKCLILAFTILFSQLIFGQGTEAISLVKADTISQIENINYQRLEINESIKSENLIKVYINGSSKIMIDHSMAKPEKVGEIVFQKLKSNIDFNTSELNSKTNANVKKDLKILIRKSVLTNNDDYSTMKDQVNKAIWEFMNYCSQKVYGSTYKQLDKNKRIEIRKLIPLNNYLADDVEF